MRRILHGCGHIYRRTERRGLVNGVGTGDRWTMPECSRAPGASARSASAHCVTAAVVATLIVLLLAVGIAAPAVPRAELLRVVDHAKRYIDGPLADFGPFSERLSDDAVRVLEEVGVQMERGHREEVHTEYEQPRVVAKRSMPKVFRPNISGRVRVVDGDTIHIGQERIRLHGIDAPESQQSSRPIFV